MITLLPPPPLFFFLLTYYFFSTLGENMNSFVRNHTRAARLKGERSVSLHAEHLSVSGRVRNVAEPVVHV